MKRSSLLYISDLILDVEDKLSKRKDFDYQTFIHHKCIRYDIADAEELMIQMIKKCLSNVNKKLA